MCKMGAQLLYPRLDQAGFPAWYPRLDQAGYLTHVGPGGKRQLCASSPGDAFVFPVGPGGISSLCVLFDMLKANPGTEFC